MLNLVPNGIALCTRDGWTENAMQFAYVTVWEYVKHKFATTDLLKPWWHLLEAVPAEEEIA